MYNKLTLEYSKIAISSLTFQHNVEDCVITCVTLIFCQQHYRGDTNLYMIDVTLNNLFASA